MQFYAICKVTQPVDLQGNPTGDPYNQVQQESIADKEVADMIVSLYRVNEPTQTFIVEQYSAA
jgi:hypothetical protein